MRIRWLRKALRNLDDEATYIGADDPTAARQVVERALDAVSMLAEQPGLVGHELDIARKRHLPVGPVIRDLAVDAPDTNKFRNALRSHTPAPCRLAPQRPAV